MESRDVISPLDAPVRASRAGADGNFIGRSMDGLAAVNAEYTEVFHQDAPARSVAAVDQFPIDEAVEIEACAHGRSGR